jgi:hypothetical protein
MAAAVLVSSLSLATSTALLRAANQREREAKARSEDNFRLAHENAMEVLWTSSPEGATCPLHCAISEVPCELSQQFPFVQLGRDMN